MKTLTKLVILVLISTFVLSPTITQAEDSPDEIANSFYVHGQKMLKQGNYEEAINDFSRGLLLSPQDERLHDALKGLSREKNVPAAQKMELILLEDLLAYTKKLKDKSDYFRYKRNVLGEELIEKGFDRSFFEKEMIALDDELKAKHEMQEQEIQERYAKGEDPLKVIHDSLKLENKRLQNEIELFEKQYDKLREVNAKHGYIQDEVAYLSPAEFNRKQRFYDEKGNRLPVDVKPVKMVSTDLPDVTGITTLLDAAKVKLDDMNSVIGDRDDKIDELSNEVVDLSLELTESKSNETKQKKEIKELRNELVEFESKNLLTQRLEKNYKDLTSKLAKTQSKLKDKERQIKELDSKIQDLMAKGEGLEKKLEGRDLEVAEYQRQIRELKKESQKIVKFKKEVSRLKGELDKAAEYQDEAWKLRHEVSKLKQKDKKYKEYESDIKKQEKVIKKQKKEIASKDKQLKEKDKSLKELNKQLIDFESRFELSQKIIKEKEEKLQEMETKLAKKDEEHKKEMARLEKKFEERLVRKEREITDLNSILDEYRSKLAGTEKGKTSEVSKVDDDVTRAKLVKAEDNKFYVNKIEPIKANNDAELQSIISEKNRELQQVTKMITIYKESLQDANRDIEYQKDQIDDLTKELARLDQKVLTRDRLSREKVNHIELLKDLLQQEKEKRDVRNVKLREIVKKKVVEIQELEGMLEIYKLKLKDKHFDVQDKVTMMTDLQVELDNTLVELYDKTEVIDKTHHNLVVLKDQLVDVHKRLAELQASKNQEDPVVKKEIEALQTKIDDINTFLKGELQTMEKTENHSSDMMPVEEIENVVTTELQLNQI